jgi:hypothetical protein
MLAFRAKEETVEAFILAHRLKALAPAREKFVDVTLMADIEDKLVLGRVEDAMEGDGQLDHSEIRPEMAADGGRVLIGEDADKLVADFLADPAAGGSLHTWGVAVDATLVDQDGRDVAMPTDFDDFTPAAWLRYAGPNPTIRQNLRRLQAAMAKAGFYGMRTEWWHFVTKDWKSYEAIPGITVVPAPPPKRGTVSNGGSVTRSLPPPTADNRAIRPLPSVR